MIPLAIVGNLSLTQLAVRRDAMKAQAVEKHIQRSTDITGQAEISNTASFRVSQVHIGLINSESILVIKRGTFHEVISPTRMLTINYIQYFQASLGG